MSTKSPDAQPEVKPLMGLWRSKDVSTGRFLRLKASGEPFKGIKQER